MNLVIAEQMLLRLIPSGLLFLCAFYSVKDAALRKQWTELLFKTGSIPASKRDDITLQESIKIPFLVGGVLFLIWPVIYYFYDSYTAIPVIAVVLPTPKPTPTKTPRGFTTVTPTPTPFRVVAPIPQDIPGQPQRPETVYIPTPTPQPGAAESPSGPVTVLPGGGSSGGPPPVRVN